MISILLLLLFTPVEFLTPELPICCALGPSSCCSSHLACSPLVFYFHYHLWRIFLPRSFSVVHLIGFWLPSCLLLVSTHVRHGHNFPEVGHTLFELDCILFLWKLLRTCSSYKDLTSIYSRAEKCQLVLEGKQIFQSLHIKNVFNPRY